MHDKAREIVDCAKGYLDVKYRHRGRNKIEGVDCAGLWIAVLNDLGIKRWDTTKYSRHPNPREFRMAMLEAEFVQVKDFEHGAVCRVEEKNWAVHTVIYELDENDEEWFIHAWAPSRKVIREHASPERKSRVIEIMRFPS